MAAKLPRPYHVWFALAIGGVVHAGELSILEEAMEQATPVRVIAIPTDADFVGPPVSTATPTPPVEPIQPPQGTAFSSVYEAVTAGDLALLESLLESGVPAQSVTIEGDTPLCAALRLGRPELTITLLLHGADPRVAGTHGEPPAALAALRRHPLLLKMILAAGADPNAAFGDEVSPDALALVSEKSLRRELAEEEGMTPLMICSARGDAEAVALLLAYGADTEAHTMPHKRYALEMAADRNYHYVMRLLLGRKPESEPRVLITVDLTRQRAKLQIDGETKISTSISSGREGYETPPGHYVITNKYKEWISTVYKVPMPNFLRLNCSPIGLHAGYVTGSPASHGCIRLPQEISAKFYKLARVGDEVIVEY
jgi:lipoprotein-anchoring transpeptidase ErfK/SrfK